MTQRAFEVREQRAMERRDIEFCARCAQSALGSWKGWPHRDVIPLLPQLHGGTCQVCGSHTGVRNQSITWLNYHSEFSTGLPDYWLLVVAERPNKWGLPYLAIGECPLCGHETVVSEMQYPNGEREVKHNCQQCGVQSAGR